MNKEKLKDFFILEEKYYGVMFVSVLIGLLIIAIVSFNTRDEEEPKRIDKRTYSQQIEINGKFKTVEIKVYSVGDKEEEFEAKLK